MRSLDVDYSMIVHRRPVYQMTDSFDIYNMRFDKVLATLPDFLEKYHFLSFDSLLLPDTFQNSSSNRKTRLIKSEKKRDNLQPPLR